MSLNIYFMPIQLTNSTLLSKFIRIIYHKVTPLYLVSMLHVSGKNSKDLNSLTLTLTPFTGRRFLFIAFYHFNFVYCFQASKSAATTEIVLMLCSLDRKKQVTINNLEHYFPAAWTKSPRSYVF